MIRKDGGIVTLRSIIMRKLTLTSCAILLALSVGTALAADVTGTWTGEMGGPDGGGGMTITFHFKQDGTKLTGTVDGPQGDPLQISDGKVEGDKISFTLKFDRGDGGGMKITHQGTISGDEIKLSSKMEGGPDGGGPGPGGPMTLKRSK
jgi:hypothetical protein